MPIHLWLRLKPWLQYWTRDFSSAASSSEATLKPAVNAISKANQSELLNIFIAAFYIGRFTAPQAPVQPMQAIEVGVETVPVVAVLPLKAMSSSEEGSFLASGLHDDLLTKLAKLRVFKVISRTSVMEYADTNKNLRQIGEELGARIQSRPQWVYSRSYDHPAKRRAL